MDQLSPLLLPGRPAEWLSWVSERAARGLADAGAQVAAIKEAAPGDEAILELWNDVRLSLSNVFAVSALMTVVHPDPVLLFRYSALTFNSHRIHYDRPYATDEEGYPGLVVHGPLLATLLLDALHETHPAARITQFEFRAQRPLFDTADFVVAGNRADGAWPLWAANMTGAVAVDARAVLAGPADGLAASAV